MKFKNFLGKTLPVLFLSALLPASLAFGAVIEGTSGNDLITHSASTNDDLLGGAGNDTYEFTGTSFGYDYVEDASGTDTIIFKDLLSTQATVADSGTDDMLITFSTGAKVLIIGEYLTGQIERVYYKDTVPEVIGPNANIWDVGSTTDVATTTTFGEVFMGGGPDVDDAFKWMINKANGGDFVIFRSTGTNAYNDYVMGLSTGMGKPLNSVTTILVTNIAGAGNDAGIIDRVNKAEAIWFTGGNQADYVNFLRGTPLLTALNNRLTTVPFGGTSAGAMFQGEFIYDAIAANSAGVSLDSPTALNNPYGPALSFSRNVPVTVQNRGLITDTHFQERDRMGRWLVFMARQMKDHNLSQIKGIATNEGTALAVEANGVSTVMVQAGAVNPFVYVANSTVAPTTVVSGQKLSWNGVNIQKLFTTSTFNTTTWNGTGIGNYTLNVASGVISSTNNGTYGPLTGTTSTPPLGGGSSTPAPTSTPASTPAPTATPAPTTAPSAPTYPAATKTGLTGTTGADVLYGNANANTISGYELNDTLLGGAGNDTIYGDSGNDTLDGQAGNDTLRDSGGTDTFNIVGTSFGADIIRDDAGTGDTLRFWNVNSTAVKFNRTATDLIITLNTSNKVTIWNYFASGTTNAGSGHIENIIFADLGTGRPVTIAKINAMGTSTTKTSRIDVNLSNGTTVTGGTGSTGDVTYQNLIVDYFVK